MESDLLLENIIEQIKEAQLKLGYAKEVIRLYYPVSSLCSLLKIKTVNGNELIGLLEQEKIFDDTKLGKLDFSLCAPERVEVQISEKGAAYVHEHVPDSPFLVSMIELFHHNHEEDEKPITIDAICACFKQFNENYICEKQKPGADFDYVLYFPDQKPDAWYYCVKFEMNHAIYHRFTKEDYLELIK